MRILSACLSQPVVTVVQVHTAAWSRTDPRAPHGSRNHGAHCLMSCPKTFTLHRAMSLVTPHLTTPRTCTPSLSSTQSSSHVLHPHLSEHTPCGDLRPHLFGALAEPRPFTGYEHVGRQRSVTQRGGRLDQRATHEEIFFSSWLRGDAEGIAEEMKKTNKNAQDEKKRTSGNKEFEGGGEGVEIDDEPVCFGFCSTLTLALCFWFYF